MAASVALRGWRPRTLTDRRNDISTVGPHSTPAGFAPAEINSPHPGVVELIVKSGTTVRQVRLRMESLPAPSWLKPALNNCGHLLLLPFGWDGADAPSVEGVAIQAAIDALCSFMADTSSVPQWTPTRNGGVQLDWHEQGIDLEIQCEPSEPDAHVVFCDQRDESADWDGLLSDNLPRLRSLFAGRLNASVKR
jgi:hypothetical protein